MNNNGKDEALGARIRRCIRAARGCLTRDVLCRWAPVPYMVQDAHVGELQVTVQTAADESRSRSAGAGASASG